MATLFLALTVICWPWSVMTADWLPGSGALLGVTLVALPVGLWAANGRRPGWRLTLVGLLGGVGVGLWLIGALPSLGNLLSVAWGTVAWLQGGRVGEWPGLPLVRASVAATTELLQRVTTWGQAARGTTPSTDTLPVLWVGCAVTWMVVVWTAWVYRRWRRPGLAVLPLGLLLTQHLVFAPSVAGQFAVFLASVLGLMVQTRFLAQRERWEREGIDYSAEVHPDTTLLSLLFVVLLPVLAWLVPLPILYGPARAAWEAFREPREAVGTVAKRMLGPIQRPPGSGLFATTDLTDLPYGRILTGPPSLRDAVVMRVQTSDPPPVYEEDEVARHYWRTETMDTYTGRGWENSGLTERRVGATPSLEAALVNVPSGARLRQRFTLLGGTPPAAVNDPIALDVDYTRVERAPDDLAGIRVAAGEYTVVSRLPQASEARLRTLSPPTLERYLALPNSLPRRVRELAQSLTADAPTAYDKALAIQNYLRSYPYELEIQPAPPGRDVTDYFLFDLKKGYCDYMSTAMIVMLRSVGIPARLAAGYATGGYDRQLGEYVVTGQEAHSWPEVFFPGVGWVEFEPTPYRAPIQRPTDDLPLPDLQGRIPATEPPRAGVRWGALLPWLLGVWILGLLVWAVGLVQERRFLALPPAEQIRVLWRRLLSRSARLGHPLEPSQTPTEFARDLAADLAPRRLELGEWNWRGDESRAPLLALADEVSETLYAPAPPDERDAQTARLAWDRVRRVLWLLLRQRHRAPQAHVPPQRGPLDAEVVQEGGVHDPRP